MNPKIRINGEIRTEPDQYNMDPPTASEINQSLGDIFNTDAELPILENIDDFLVELDAEEKSSRIAEPISVSSAVIVWK